MRILIVLATLPFVLLGFLIGYLFRALQLGFAGGADCLFNLTDAASKDLANRRRAAEEKLRQRWTPDSGPPPPPPS